MRIPNWVPITLIGLVAACDTMAPNEPGNLVPRTVAEDLSLPAVELNGSRFHAQTFGNPANPVIVFLHGGPGGDYRSLLKLGERFNGYSLADDYYLVFWDQRGAGLSQRENKESITIDAYTDDLNAIVNRYAPGRKVFLVGESWGGMFATKYINTYPQRVAGAVLIESGPMDGETAERLKKDFIDFNIRSEWLNDYAWNSQFLSPDDHARMDYELTLGARDAQPRYHQSKDNPSPAWRIGAVANRYLNESGQKNGVFTYDFTTNLSAYTTPVLFIAGALSEVLGPSLQEKQVLHYPSASLNIFANVGHDVAWIKAPEVQTAIRTYLNARKGNN